MGRNEWGIPTGETYVTPMTKIETPQIGLYFLESKQKEGLARPAASRPLSDALFTITIPLSTHCPPSPLLSLSSSEPVMYLLIPCLFPVTEGYHLDLFVFLVLCIPA